MQVIKNTESYIDSTRRLYPWPCRQDVLLLRCPVCALPWVRLRYTPTAATRSGRFIRLRLRCPIKSSGLRISSILSTAAHTAPSLYLPPAALGLVAGGAPIAPHRRPGYCVWCVGIGSLRFDLLAMHLNVGAAICRPQKYRTIETGG